MREKYSAIAIVALLIAGPIQALAKSQVYNGIDHPLTVYWKADGCAELKAMPTCFGNDDQGLICKKTKIEPGETKGYKYESGETNRRVMVLGCLSNSQSTSGFADGKQLQGRRDTGNSGKQRRCAATYKEGEEGTQAGFNFHCGYSDSEWKEIQGQAVPELR